jgi:AraC-like DNA-binding protein
MKIEVDVMLDDSSPPHALLQDDSFEELWFKLRHAVRMHEVGDNPSRRAVKMLESYLLVVVNRNEVQFTIDDRLFSLGRGAVFIGKPGQRFEYMGGSLAGTVDGYMLLFDAQGDLSILDKALRYIESERSGGVIPEAFAVILLDLCEKVHLYWQQDSRIERLRSQAAFHELLFQVLNKTIESPCLGLQASLEQIRQYLEIYYHENLSMERLAQGIGVSSRHFRRAFKQRFGINATDFVTDLRISQAKRLINTTKQPIAQIARQVGYQDESHFRRTFKREMGIPPAIYVKNQQIKIAACSFPNIGQLLPLSVIPFAAPIDHDWTDYYRRKYHTEVMYPLHHNNEINYKTLLSARPDRILAIDAFGSDEFQEKLSEIAPVLTIPWRTKDWREHLLLAAAFLDKSQEADEWLAVYDDKADRVCDQWNQINRKEKLLLLMIDRQDCYMWEVGACGQMSRQHLPFTPERHKSSTAASFKRLAPEQLGGFDADRIVLLLSEDRQSLLAWRRIQLSESWKSLKAVRNHGVQPIWLGPWFEYTAYNHGLIIDQAVKTLV